MIRMLLRADAYPAIGTGDLMSLIHFSRHPRVIAAGWECHFMIRDHRVARDLLERRQVANVQVIAAQSATAQETRAVARYSADHGIDAVLFEITDRRLDTFDLSGVDAVLGAVDFYSWIPKGLDLVVNWDTEAAGRYRAKDYPGTDFFLGPEYVFLAPDFLAGHRRWQPAAIDRRPIVVAMGGADEFDLTGRILSELIPQSPPETSFTAIVGAGYDHLDKLQVLAGRAGARLTVKRNVTDMCGEFLGARHVFGAGGLTAYELVATGTPCSLVACYEHQIHRCRTFAEKGLARYLGYRASMAPIEMPPPAVLPVGSAGFLSRLDRLVSSLEEKVMKRRLKTAALRPRAAEVRP
ncbi:MAG: hypothetical protein ABIL58_28915 [Pseudomonadota bacterium]